MRAWTLHLDPNQGKHSAKAADKSGCPCQVPRPGCNLDTICVFCLSELWNQNEPLSPPEEVMLITPSVAPVPPGAQQHLWHPSNPLRMFSGLNIPHLRYSKFCLLLRHVSILKCFIGYLGCMQINHAVKEKKC